MALASPLINVMTGAARKAGRGLLRDFGEVSRLQVSRKGPADFVSAADRRTAQILREELLKARPRYGLLCEESGFVDGTDISNRWIVDPLDGTTNFLHGLPHFAISIALERDGDIHAGVVYEPIRDETFWAERGAGAHLNRERIRVSARQKLADAVLATGIPYLGREGHEPFLASLREMMARCAGIRRFGSAALDLAYVAAGRYDGFWEAGLELWDIAAGVALVREAGGFVTDLDGGDRALASGNVLAANDRLHEPLLAILQAVRPRPGSAP